MPRVLIGSIAEMRVSISFAALLVKVTARMPPGLTLPVWISHAIRVVRTRVLPEPAPARISADWSGRVTAASCWGLRFSRRLCIRATANARFYRDAELHSDFVLEFRELGVAFQRLDDGFRVLLGLEIREAHAVDALLARLRRDDLGGMARPPQCVVYPERCAELLRRSDRDLPSAAPARDSPALLLRGLRSPLRELLHGRPRDRARHVALERVVRQGLVERKRPLARRRDLDLSLYHAHDIALGRGPSPVIGAADGGRHVVDRDAQLALAGELADDPGGEAERALGDEDRGVEDAVVHLHAIEEQRAFLAHAHVAAIGELEEQPRLGAGVEPVSFPQ